MSQHEDGVSLFILTMTVAVSTFSAQGAKHAVFMVSGAERNTYHVQAVVNGRGV